MDYISGTDVKEHNTQIAVDKGQLLQCSKEMFTLSLRHSCCSGSPLHSLLLPFIHRHIRR